MLTVSLYARVSSEKQVQENTIASQLSALENKIKADGHELLDEHKFVDNGYSGSNLVRPALEKLRNKVAEGKIDIIYIHSPDRLSRKYAYQMVLLEELQKAKVEVIFLNNQINDSPEAHLLLQMQGMIAEYEHTKITERCRRGKIYAAKKGSVNVMCRAPYGYRYINKQMEGGQARFEVYEEEAEVVRKLFSWIGRERMSAGEVCRQLNTMSIMSAKGKCWNKGTLCGTLKNPVYKGQAAFGKTKVGAKLPQIRPYKHSCEQPKKNSSTYRVGREHWIYIPVPKIVDEDLFDIVQKQLAENAKRQRARQIGTTNLLQGLLVCKRCQYSYYAKRYGKSQKKCYRCIGADAYRFAGNKICNSKTIRASTLETAVWEEVKSLLKNPNRILKEYQRRLSELQKSPCDQITDSLKKQDDKLKQGISRLIDSYTQGYISKEEFEPRIKAAKQSLKIVEEEKKKIFNRKNLQQELTLVVTNLEEFFSNIKSKLDDLDWLTKRNVIRILVKRIEVDIEEVNIVFRVKDIPHSTEHNNEKGQNLQHCRSSQDIVNFMYDSEHNVSVVNPAQIKAFGRSELLRNKTDKSDAAMIARFCIANKPNLWKPAPPEVRRLRDLYRCLQAFKDDKLQQMNRLENKNTDSHCKQAILEVIATIDTQTAALEKEINEHVNNHLHLKNITEKIKTIKGVGHLTAVAVVAEMPSVDNFDNARQFTAFAGLNPEHYQSGSSVSKKSRICKIGSERIRKALYMPAIVVKNHNSYFQKFCQRLASKGKCPKVIIVALMRKLMHVFFGILKNDQPFNGNLVR